MGGVLAMEFITAADNTDNILIWRESDVAFANDYLLSLATSFGLTDAEIELPPRNLVKKLGAAVACRECAAAMVGSDTTVMVGGGNRSDDIYLQKYNLYRATVKDLENRLDYRDFAVDGTTESGKGGVGTIRLSRA